MPRTVGILGVVALALVGCKKPRGDFAEVMKAFEGFASAMCACKDKACADRVQESMTTWSMEMAKNADRHEDKPDEAALKAMVDLGQKYAECMTKLMSDVSVEPPNAPEPVPRPLVKLSVPADRPSIAMLINEARAYTYSAEEHLAVHVLQLRYVRPDGALDPTYGELTIGFGNRLPTAPVPIEDDPDRPTGAPIPAPVVPAVVEDTSSKRAMCPEGRWSSKAGWTWGERLCMRATDLTPRCSTAEVWQRAKATWGPVDGVAILQLVAFSNGTQVWMFTIKDALRKVDIALQLDDTCAPVVEKP